LKSRFRWFDFFLLACVVISGIFIFTYLTRTPTKNVVVQQAPTVAPGALSPVKPELLKPEPIALEIPALDFKPANLAAVLEDPKNLKFKSGQIQQTRRCSRTANWGPGAFGITSNVVAEGFSSNRLNIVFGPGNKNCFKTGEVVQFVAMEENPKADRPYFRLLGETKIRAIFEVPPADVPEELLKAGGLNRNSYMEYLAGEATDIVFFIDPIVKASSARTKKTTIVFPRIEIVTAAELQTFKASYKNLKSIDLRTSAAATPLNLKLDPFNPKVTPSRLSEVSLPPSWMELVSANNSRRDQPILVVCDENHEARCLALLSALATMNLSNVNVTYTQFY